MSPSLLDWLGFGDDDAGAEKKAADLPEQIDLTRDIERGWPIHPADADTLTGAFNALGLLPPSDAAGSRAPDEALFSAIERFQEANGVAPSGSMGRGSMTILHLNKTLGLRKRSAPMAALAVPANNSSGPSSLHELVRARRARPTLLSSRSYVEDAGGSVRRTLEAPGDIASGAYAFAGPWSQGPTDPFNKAPQEARFVPVFAPTQPPVGNPWAYVLALILGLIALGMFEGSNPPSNEQAAPGGTRRQPQPEPPSQGTAETPREIQRRRAGADHDFDPADDSYCHDGSNDNAGANEEPEESDGEEEDPDSRVLGRALNRAGLPSPESFERHHIVAGSRRLAAEAQDILSECNIGINDCENGVFLPGPGLSEETRRMLPEVYHRSLGNEYYEAVTKELQGVRGDCDKVRQRLRWIRWCLLNGRFPRHENL